MRKLVIAIVVASSCIAAYVTCRPCARPVGADVTAAASEPQGVLVLRPGPPEQIISSIVADGAGGDGSIFVPAIDSPGCWPELHDGVWQNHTGATTESVFEVRVDDLDSIRVCAALAGTVTGLNLGERHLVDIRMDGKRLTSFNFRFEERGWSQLQLRYCTIHGTWSLEKARSSGQGIANKKLQSDNESSMGKQGESAVPE